MIGIAVNEVTGHRLDSWNPGGVRILFPVATSSRPVLGPICYQVISVVKLSDFFTMELD